MAGCLGAWVPACSMHQRPMYRSFQWGYVSVSWVTFGDVPLWSASTQDFLLLVGPLEHLMSLAKLRELYVTCLPVTFPCVFCWLLAAD